MSRPPLNLLFLHAHDMGRYLSPYGFPAPTPRMQALAESGVVFRNAHSAAPTCSPSRAALLTGLTAHQAGMLGLAHRGFDLANADRHLASYLGQHGYETILAGIQHEIHPAREGEIYHRRLPQNFLEDPAERDRHAAHQAASSIRTAGAKPWMLWAGFFYPHRPFAAAESMAINPDYVRPPAPLPDTPGIRQDMAGYYASVGHTDQVIGIILDALRESGQEDRTLIILTTDHGIAFPHMKCRLTAHGTGVALVIRHPRLAKGAGVCDALVSHLDLYPTICEMLELPAPGWCLGKSLVPLFTSGKGEIREDLFAEVNIHAAAEPMRSVRTQRYNYIRIFDEDLRVPLANIDEGRAKTELLGTDWAGKPREPVQLYDLFHDPGETNNLCNDPKYRGVRDDMERRLLRWMEATEDPLLLGPLETPAAAVINTRESVNPETGPFVSVL